MFETREIFEAVESVFKDGGYPGARMGGRPVAHTHTVRKSGLESKQPELELGIGAFVVADKVAECAEEEAEQAGL